jgi:[ribosomal protein S5]-alanine N-acetyltransferase
MIPSLYITTQKLELLPCSLEVAQAVIVRNKLEVERLLGIKVPDDCLR